MAHSNHWATATRAPHNEWSQYLSIFEELLAIETRNKSDEKICREKAEFFFLSRFAYIRPTVRGYGDNIVSLQTKIQH